MEVPAIRWAKPYLGGSCARVDSDPRTALLVGFIVPTLMSFLCLPI